MTTTSQDYIVRTLHKVKFSNTIAQFCKSREPGGLRTCPDPDVEMRFVMLVIELAVRRYAARNNRKFAEADAVALVLTKLGLDVEALDAEMKGTR